MVGAVSVGALRSLYPAAAASSQQPTDPLDARTDIGQPHLTPDEFGSLDAAVKRVGLNAGLAEDAWLG